MMWKINYKDWRLGWYHISDFAVCGFTFVRPDSRSGVSETGESGTLILDVAGATDVETIVRQIFRLVLNTEEHEAREFFRYGEQRPFDPHVQLINQAGEIPAPTLTGSAFLPTPQVSQQEGE